MLPATVAQAAHVKVTRVEPEIFVPPRPGQEVRRASGAAPRPGALLRRHGAASSRSASRATASPSSPTSTSSTARAAPTSTSPASPASPPRRATPPSCSTASSRSGALGGEAANTHALVFNVKGEDLLFLDQDNAPADATRTAPPTRSSGCPPSASASVQILAPVRKGSRGAPAGHRQPRRGRPGLLLDAPRGGAASASCASCSPRPTTPPASSASWWTGSRRSSAAAAAEKGDAEGPLDRDRGPADRRRSTRWSRR